MSIDLIFGVGLFCGIVLLLVLVIIAARSKLVATGDVSIEINGAVSYTQLTLPTIYSV